MCNYFAIKIAKLFFFFPIHLHMSKKSCTFAHFCAMYKLKNRYIMNNLFKGAALLLGGALLGATAALLLTPKTGEQVRNELKDLLEEAKKQMQKQQEQQPVQEEQEA